MASNRSLRRTSLVLLFAVATLGNISAAAPQNVSDHGNSDLYCRSTTWTDIIVFYLGNYVAHAATTMSLPSHTLYDAAFTFVAALLFPASGVTRGVRAILRRAIFADTELQTAARSGALCMVVKDIPEIIGLDRDGRRRRRRSSSNNN